MLGSQVSSIPNQQNASLQAFARSSTQSNMFKHADVLAEFCSVIMAEESDGAVFAEQGVSL